MCLRDSLETFVKLLSYAHGALGGKRQFSKSVLLQSACCKRRIRIFSPFCLFYVVYFISVSYTHLIAFDSDYY